MVILLGSHALKYYAVLDRAPRDIDILGAYDDCVAFIKKHGKPKSIYPFDEGKKLVAKYENGDVIECEIDWGHGTPHELFNLVKYDKGSSNQILRNHTNVTFDVVIPSLNILYLLKMSHRYLKNSPFFLKTMKDIHTMRKMGAIIEHDHNDFFKARVKSTYTYAHPKLAVKKDEFFSDDGIQYVYDHDSIHDSVKIFDKPAYEYYKADNEQVLCSKEKWDACGEEIRFAGALEEVRVLSLERSIVPFRGTVDAKKAYEMAAMKVCTSITSGWFREYAWENYYKIIDVYNYAYVAKFWHDVETGLVKPFTGSKY